MVFPGHPVQSRSVSNYKLRETRKCRCQLLPRQIAGITDANGKINRRERLQCYSESTDPLSMLIDTAACRRWWVLSAQVLAEVSALNKRADIDGIVVQMPLPAGVNSDKVRYLNS